MPTRRRAAPYILKLGGLSHGTGEFFGQTVHNLTTTFRELQDVENLKKFAESDPETFLQYWKERKNTAKGSIKRHLEEFAIRAEKRVKTMKADSIALVSYVKSNNHQAYLDYLVGRLADEDDPSMISKLGSQINELRTRLHAASSGSGAVGGGVTQDEYVAARDKWATMREHSEHLITDRPLTAKEYDDLKKAKGEYEATLRQIMLGSDTTVTRANQMFTALNESRGPNDGYIDNVALQSDKRLLSTFKSDGDFEVWIKNRNLLPGEKAKLYAERARQLVLLAGKALGQPGLELIGKSITEAEVGSTTFASEAFKGSQALSPANKQTISDEYATYESELSKLHREQPEQYPFGPVSPAEFKRQLDASKSADDFNSRIKFNGYAGPQTYDKLKGASSAFGPATYDAASGTWNGDADAVANAKGAVAAVKAQWDIPGNVYENFKLAGFTSDQSIARILSGEITPDVAAVGAQLRATNPIGSHVAPVDGSPEQTTNPDPNAPTPDQSSGTLPTDYSHDQRAADLWGAVPGRIAPGTAPIDTAPSNGKGGPGLKSMLTTGNQEYDAAYAAANDWLNSYELPDLPEWKKPDTSPVADSNALFPFEGTPPSSMLAPQPSASRKAGQPY